MNDAAPRGHQVARAGADRRIGAEAVAMVDRALEQIGQRRQVDMRVRAHVHPLPGVEMRRAELIDEDERPDHRPRSEEHTSELQSLMRISYAVSGLKKTTE